MVQRFFHPQIWATIVPVRAITVAPFQWRHNARCTTLEWLETSSMRFKLSILMRSESQSEKGSGSVRVGGDASLSPALHVGRVVPPWAAYLSADSPFEYAYVQALLKP